MNRRDFFKGLLGFSILPWVKPDFEIQNPSIQNQPEDKPGELIDNLKPVYYDKESPTFISSGSCIIFATQPKTKWM